MAGRLKIYNESTATWDYITQYPSIASSADINTGTNDTKAVTPRAIADSFLGIKGGWSIGPSCTYNDTTSIMFAPGAITGTISAGMKIKLVNDSTTKYYWIRLFATDGGGNNIAFLTGPTALVSGAITSLYYSIEDQPYGFNAKRYTDANSWTVYNHGLWREFLRSEAKTASIASGGTGVEYTYALPVGVALADINNIATSLQSEYDAQQIIVATNIRSGNVIVGVKNTYATSISINGKIHMRILV